MPCNIAGTPVNTGICAVDAWKCLNHVVTLHHLYSQYTTLGDIRPIMLHASTQHGG